VVTIAYRTDGNFEIHLIVNQIGMRFAQIIIQTAAAKVWACEAVINRIFFGYNPDIADAIHEYFIPGEKFFRFVEIDADFIQKFADLLYPTLVNVAADPADTGVAGGKAGTSQRFAEVINCLTLGE